MPWVEIPVFGEGGGGDASVRTGTTIAEINAAGAKTDGELAILRVGTHPNKHEEWLSWDSDIDKWVGEAKVLLTQQDNWAMDLGNRTAAQLLDWSKVDNPVPYGRPYAILTGAHDFTAAAFNNDGSPSGVITVNDTTSPHSFPFTDSGGASAGTGSYLHCRAMIISYTGRTATTFTGCAVVEGTREVVPDQEYIAQTYPGGWGFVTSFLTHAGEMYVAGATLQEKLTTLMNSGFFFGAVPEVNMEVAPYWYELDQGEGQPPPQREVPPNDGLGLSASLVSLDGTGGGAPSDERNFHVTLNDWSDWPLADPTKHLLIPTLVGKMQTGGVYSGSVLDARVAVRWVADG